jgi:predicted amidohydrolase
MRVALCQLPVSPEPAINLERVAEAMTTAAQQGADLAVFPEATQARFGSDLRAVAEPVDGTFCTGLAKLAREAGVALVAGVFEPAPDGAVYIAVSTLQSWAQRGVVHPAWRTPGGHARWDLADLERQLDVRADAPYGQGSPPWSG